jgi:hypothetical protein
MYRLGNCKISYANVKKLQDSRLSKLDICLYLYLASIQDAKGICKYLSPKYIIKNVLFAKSRKTYYNCLDRLQACSLIAIEKDYSDQRIIKITLLNNKFENANDDARKYININNPILKNIFTSSEFINAKSGTKKLFFFLVINYLGKKKRLSLNHLKHICNIKNNSVLYKYLNELKQFISFERENTDNNVFYRFTIFKLDKRAAKPSSQTDNKVFLYHRLFGLSRKFRAKVDEQSVDDISNIIISVVQKHGKKGFYYSFRALLTSIMLYW